MKENYYALLICILKPVTPERSFQLLSGPLTAKRKNSSITYADTRDMISMRQQGLTYQEISKIYGISWDAVRKRINRYREKMAV